MVINVTPNQDLSSASGILNSSYMESIYNGLMEEMLVKVGRPITIHLPPEIQSDSVTNSQPQTSQYNAFFKRANNPSPTTRNTGVKVIGRDVIYFAHIRIGPKDANELGGMGKLKDNEATITVVAGALFHIQKARSISIEGRRYRVASTRPIGFIDRKFIMVHLEEIQEGDIKTNVGTNG
jgi:hypothetical protein